MREWNEYQRTISSSAATKYAWPRFTSSIVTYREIGIKLLNSRKNTKLWIDEEKISEKYSENQINLDMSYSLVYRV